MENKSETSNVQRHFFWGDGYKYLRMQKGPYKKTNENDISYGRVESFVQAYLSL